MHNLLLMDTWIVSILNLGSVSDFIMLSTFLYVFFIMRQGEMGYLCTVYAKSYICLQTHRISLEGDMEVNSSGGHGLKSRKGENSSLCSCLLFGFLLHYFKKLRNELKTTSVLSHLDAASPTILLPLSSPPTTQFHPHGY